MLKSEINRRTIIKIGLKNEMSNKQKIRAVIKSIKLIDLLLPFKNSIKKFLCIICLIYLLINIKFI